MAGSLNSLTEEAAIAMQWRSEHMSAAMNQHTAKIPRMT